MTQPSDSPSGPNWSAPGQPGDPRGPQDGPVYGAPTGPPPPGYGYQPPYRPTNTIAIIAIIAAFVVPVAAIVLGHIARSQIRRTQEDGWILTTVALICGYVFTSFQVVFFIVWFGLFFIAIVSHGLQG